jgi:hypothetical protein
VSLLGRAFREAVSGLSKERMNTLICCTCWQAGADHLSVTKSLRQKISDKSP